jgi:IclR family transcriptional regulator, blcABC operon repressor
MPSRPTGAARSGGQVSCGESGLFRDTLFCYGAPMKVAASPEPARTAKPVPALVKAAQILDLICAEGKPMRLPELTRALQLSKSTVHALCGTLVELGLLARVGTTQFAIGPHSLSWAGAFQSQSDLTTEFARVWDDIKVLPEETVTLSILNGSDVVYIACRNGNRPIGISFRAGMRLPAPYTATGKAMLSTMGEHEVRALFRAEWPPAMTLASVPNVEALLNELAETRSRGFSVDHGQSCDGASCFGAPVFGPESGPAIAGVAVALLTSIATEEAIGVAGKTVGTVADRLSRRLGGMPRHR